MTLNMDDARPETWVFLLGCQRSGTTWLANIFDASPNTLLFMEPFAPAYGIFPEFPEASYFLEHSSSALDRLLRDEMPGRLLRHKSLMSQQSMTNPRLFRLELGLVRLFNQIGQYLPCRLQDRIRKFQLLNLNRTDSNYPIYPKNDDPSVWVIKELRLAGKVPILLQSFPDARFVVIIRHPVATVHSILKKFESGGLSELRRDIDTYLPKLEAQAISKDYKNLIARCRDGSLAHKLALYWRISYETMFRQLRGHSLAEFLIYEELALHPEEAIGRVFDSIGLPLSASVQNYLSYSSRSSVEDPGSLTTVRESADYYRSWMDNVSESTQQAVLEITDESFLKTKFQPYYESE